MTGSAGDDPAIRRIVNSLLVPGLAEESIPSWLGREIDDGLGAVCWFGGEALGPARRQWPELLVLSDEEGGTVTRLESTAGSSFPGNAALGALDDIGVTEQVGAAIGAMSRRAGIDVVLAPVVDVNSEPDNPVIGVRSFGDDAALVARHGAAFVRGVHGQAVAACAKHYPGHGATRTDSHLGLPVVDVDQDTFMARDVAPFAAAVDAGVRCIMTAHIVVPAVDDTPATMSAIWMAHLRADLGFTGVVTTDALDMHAISRGVGRGPGAVAALRAGADLVGIGNPRYPEVYDAALVLDDVRRHILAGVSDGVLTVGRLEEAADRVAELRAWLAMGRERDVADLSPDAARELGRDVARRTIRARGGVRIAGAPHVVVRQRHDIAAGRRHSLVLAALTARRPTTTSSFVDGPDDVGVALDVANGRPLVLVSDGLDDDAVVSELRRVRSDTVVVHTGAARRAGSDADPPAIDALGGGAANAEVVADLLVGDDR